MLAEGSELSEIGCGWELEKYSEGWGENLGMGCKFHINMCHDPNI